MDFILISQYYNILSFQRLTFFLKPHPPLIIFRLYYLDIGCFTFSQEQTFSALITASCVLALKRVARIRLGLYLQQSNLWRSHNVRASVQLDLLPSRCVSFQWMFSSSVCFAYKLLKRAFVTAVKQRYSDVSSGRPWCNKYGWRVYRMNTGGMY